METNGLLSRLLRLRNRKNSPGCVGFVFVLFGMLFLVIMGFSSRATCQRIEPAQVDCTIRRTLFSLIPVGTVEARRVEQAWIDRNCDEDCTYRIVLTTAEGDVPVSEMYSSGYGDKRQMADAINAYLEDGGSDAVDFKSGGMGFFIAIPFIFIAIGLVTMARSVFRFIGGGLW